MDTANAIIESLNLIVLVVSGLTTVAATLYGAWQQAKKKEYSESLDLTEQALRGVVAALEMAPKGSKVADVKRLAEQLAITLGTQGPKLKETVRQVSAIFDAWNLAGGGGAEDVELLKRAATAVQASREARKAKSGVTAGAVGLMLVVGLCASISGCVAVGPEHLTRETVWPAQAGLYPAEIVVQWPEGVRKGDVRTWEIEDWGDVRTLSTAPLPDRKPTSGTATGP